ncbi:MAG: hypothetical protein RI897_3083 [Verrucomicrobiota bacterium]|jgi:hypothetical protein
MRAYFVLLVFLLGGGWAGGVHAALLEVGSGVVESEWVVKHEGRVVCRYSYVPGRYKPYVKELAGVDGRNVLRDAPSDHLHHHALMYAIGVNGLNFWEEAAGAGVQRVVESRAGLPVVRGAGVVEAGFEQVLHWVSPGDAFLADSSTRALLVERRHLVLRVDEVKGDVILDWESEFEVGTVTNEVVLGGANYFGLGMRFLSELDSVAVHFNEAGRLDLGEGRQHVSQHPWTAVGFEHGGWGATLVLMGDPGNGGGDPFFFSMRTPFAYLCATQRLDVEPRRYRAGEKFRLRYGVVVMGGVRDVGEVEGCYRGWLDSGR